MTHAKLLYWCPDLKYGNKYHGFPLNSGAVFIQNQGETCCKKTWTSEFGNRKDSFKYHPGVVLTKFCQHYFITLSKFGQSNKLQMCLFYFSLCWQSFYTNSFFLKKCFSVSFCQQISGNVHMFWYNLHTAEI